MASRRDQLNAYTFAKRRMLASFVQSSPDASDEGAPRPLRAILPGSIVGVVVLAAFGAWGMFKPTAPQGWDKPGQNVIIASKSTTRYVVLKTQGKVQLHPVLNMASAKLVLDSQNDVNVVTVDESILDNGKIPHGVTIGIPYAPDRLPSGKEAGAAKEGAGEAARRRTPLRHHPDGQEAVRGRRAGHGVPGGRVRPPPAADPRGRPQTAAGDQVMDRHPAPGRPDQDPVDPGRPGRRGERTR
jgi:hypothetical protein